MYLKRYHDIELSSSGVWRILKRLDMNRLPTSKRYVRHAKRWQLYEKPQPGHQVQIGVKFVAPLGGRKRRYYQFTAIDDCTRLRILRIYGRLNQKTAVLFVDYVLEKLPSGSSRSRPTTAQSSSPRSTGTSSTGGSATSTSSPSPRG
jgi:hypothetical protein